MYDHEKAVADFLGAAESARIKKAEGEPMPEEVRERLKSLQAVEVSINVASDPTYEAAVRDEWLAMAKRFQHPPVRTMKWEQIELVLEQVHQSARQLRATAEELLRAQTSK